MVFPSETDRLVECGLTLASELAEALSTTSRYRNTV